MQINIHSLKPGTNQFQFEIPGDVFNIDDENVEVEKVDVDSEVQKNDQSIVVNSRIKSNVKLTCDRCLKNFLDVIEDDLMIYYTSDTESAKHDDEQVIRVLKPGSNEIDLTTGFRESILLSVPMKRICSDDCKGLCPSCGINLNEGQCDCKFEKFDSRWEGLRKLLKDDIVTENK